MSVFGVLMNLEKMMKNKLGITEVGKANQFAKLKPHQHITLRVNLKELLCKIK